MLPSGGRQPPTPRGDLQCNPGVAGSGDVAQLAEHRLCKAGVRGSIPLVSTTRGPVITAAWDEWTASGDQAEWETMAGDGLANAPR